MRTFDNPHPRQQPMMNQPTMMQPQMTQEQAMHAAIVNAMNQNGYQMAQQNNGQVFFYHTQNGHQVSYAQAMGMMQQQMQMRQPQQPMMNYGYPQQQNFYDPNPRQMPFNTGQPPVQNSRFPGGSVQGAVVRPEQTYDPLEQARWGGAFTTPAQQPTQSQQPVSQPQPEKAAMTHASPMKEIIQLPFMSEQDTKPFEYRASSVTTVEYPDTSEPTGSSLYDLAEQLRALSKPTAAYPSVVISKVFHTDGYMLPKLVTDDPLYATLNVSDPRVLYRNMRDYAANTNRPKGLAGSLFTAMLMNLDRDLTQATNDFLKIISFGFLIESFCTDFNVLLKNLRNSTEGTSADEFSEDDLIAYLTNFLKNRLTVVMNESDAEAVVESTIFASTEIIVLIDLPVTNFQIEHDKSGKLTVSDKVLAQIHLLAKEVAAEVFYISTLDKTLMRVYRLKNKTTQVEVLGYKD